MSRSGSIHGFPRITGPLICIVAAACFSCPQYAGAAKTDVLHIKNGDRITGEIKEMQRGEMRIDTAASGEIRVKWDHIVRIESDKHIQFETIDGSIYSGSLADAAEEHGLRVKEPGGLAVLSYEDVVLVRPVKLKENLWDQMDKTLQVGFSYTQASDILRWNIQTEVAYKTLDFESKLAVESFVTNDRDGNDSRRAKIDLRYMDFVGERYFWYGSVGAERNDELGISERYLLGAGYGRFLWQRPVSELGASIGISANQERSTGSATQSATTTDNLEGVVALDWRHFRLNTPKSLVTAQLTWFPGITDAGRNRADLKLNMRQEFFVDLFWNVELYASHDSRPPAGAKSGDDWGIITSLEYEW